MRASEVQREIDRMTQNRTSMTKDEALIKIATVNAMDYEYQAWAREALAQPEQEPVAYWHSEFLKHNTTSDQPEQEPVAMKFKIYKPTMPDPTRQDINNALLPWVYDQDRSSGFEASMWVTPVATLSSQRKPLTDEEIDQLLPEIVSGGTFTVITYGRAVARAIEAAHGIKGEA